MMYNWGYGSGGFAAVGVLWLITWILTIAVLVALVRWLWIKGDKEKKGR